jgi:hypothetical protein
VSLRSPGTSTNDSCRIARLGGKRTVTFHAPGRSGKTSDLASSLRAEILSVAALPDRAGMAIGSLKVRSTAGTVASPPWEVTSAYGRFAGAWEVRRLVAFVTGEEES